MGRWRSVLFQAGRMVVPERDASFAYVAARAASFGVALLSSRGMVTDWGIQSELVSYIARQRRTQLSIVLEGRGYFDLGARIFLLGVGDAVLSDQRCQGHEGYAGSPARILIVDWEGDETLGPEHRGPPITFHLGPADVAHLSAIVARPLASRPEIWAGEIVGTLRALGLPAPRGGIEEELYENAHVAALYRALAHVRSHLHEYPSISDVAAQVGLSERHVRRAFEQLDRDLGVGTNGWRDFLRDTRIGAAQQLLSVPGLSLSRVASLAGYRSSVALCHSFAERGDSTPGAIARRVHERWELAMSREMRERLRGDCDRSVEISLLEPTRST
jgi:AraC-like DNA-binding protein